MSLKHTSNQLSIHGVSSERDTCVYRIYLKRKRSLFPDVRLISYYKKKKKKKNRKEEK